jgi:hypothetical protein
VAAICNALLSIAAANHMKVGDQGAAASALGDLGDLGVQLSQLARSGSPGMIPCTPQLEQAASKRGKR